jgi:tRNA wybutosine-synthesizing protein 3
LHVCCRTLEAAQELVDKAKFCGFKRSGIMSTRRRIMVEIVSTERVETIVAKGGELLVPAEYLEELRVLANDRLRRARKKMDKFLSHLLR